MIAVPSAIATALFVIVFQGVETKNVSVGASNPCCTDETGDTCSVSTSVWISTTSNLYPDLSAYPGFSWGSNYYWMQDNSGTIDFTEFSIDDMNTVLSFDYYFNAKQPDTATYLHFFLDVDGLPAQKTLLLSVTAAQDKWIHTEVSCDNPEISFCCGSINSFPCTGTIEVTGSSSSSSKERLYAVDNIGNCADLPTTSTISSSSTTTCTSSTTTNTNPITTETSPATTNTNPITTDTSPITTNTSPTTTEIISTTTWPLPISCCSFEVNTCSWSLTDWLWSEDVPASITPPPSSTNYLWTQTNGATASSLLLHGLTETSVFSLLYYVAGSTASDSIFITFQEDGSSEQNVQAVLTLSADAWIHTTIDCYSKTAYGSPGCCTSYPCSGYLVIVATMTTTDSLCAFDDFSINNGCGDAFSCCYFEDEFLCGYTNLPEVSEDVWSWSRHKSPALELYPHFNSRSNYMWYQNSASSIDNTQTFQSPKMEIFPDSVISVTYFAGFSHHAQNIHFQIGFSHADVENVLLVVEKSTKGWKTIGIIGLYDAMCHSQPCHGYLNFGALKSDLGQGDVFFAVSDVSVDESTTTCAPSQISDTNWLDATKLIKAK